MSYTAILPSRVRSRSLPSTSESAERPLVANLTAASPPSTYPGPRSATGGLSYSAVGVVKAFLFYLYETTCSYLFVLCTSPSSVVFDPLSTFYALLVYHLLWTALGTVVVVVGIGNALGLRDVIDRLSKDRFRGYSIANWANARIFDGSEDTIADARKMLTGTYRTTLPPEIEKDDNGEPSFSAVKTVRVFSIPLAKTLLLMSALVYERTGSAVLAAHQQILKSLEDDQSPNEKERLRAGARANFAASEETIRTQAEKWGLEFAGVSELGLKPEPDGPFAGIFASSPPSTVHDLPFLVLVFKGTSLDNFAEILIDASMDRVPASPFFGPGGGTCHRGFYTSLFVAEDSHRASGADSYGTIVRFLRVAAARMRRQYAALPSSKGFETPKVPLWITAHSLGSSLAALCFARFLRSPQDLGEDIELRDCYAFATPRIGDGDFASAFEHSLVSPRDRPHNLWRVTLQSDIVTRLPFGIFDDESSRASLSSTSPLNYAHLGPSMTLRPIFPLFAPNRPSWRVEGLRAFHAATDVWVAGPDYQGEAEVVVGRTSAMRHRSLRSRDWMDDYLSDTEPPDPSTRPRPRRRVARSDIAVRALRLGLKPLLDHFPAAYFEGLDAMQSTVLA
ncbi:hypothetical protein JCM11491_005386 [Sporobolomyces phaffii]